MAAFTVVSLVAVVPRSARADDNKMYPGSFCQPEDTSTDVRATYTGAMNNYGSYSHSVNCPILRDRTTNTNGTDDVWVNVYRGSLAGSTLLSCTFYSIDGNTGSPFFYNAAATAGVGREKLVIRVTNSAGYGPYSLHCLLPIGSSIVAYQLSEHVPTD